MSVEDVVSDSAMSSLEPVPGGCDGGEVSAHGLDHSAPPHPQPDANASASVQQQPDGCGLVGSHAVARVDQPESYQRSNSVTEKERKK